MKDKYKYLGKNTLIFMISSFGTKFLSFFLVPLYTNVLTTQEYGIVDIITTTAILMIYIFTINIGDAVLRFALDRKEKQHEILCYGIRVLLKGSLLLVFSLVIIKYSGLVKWEAYYYWGIFFYFFFTALYQIYSNYLRAIDLVKEVAIAGIISSVTMIVSNICFLLIIKLGILGYLFSMIVGPLWGTVYCILKIKLPFKTYCKAICSPQVQKSMRAYCIPLILNNIALWINSFLDKYFLVGMCGVEANGIYAVAYKIPTILTMCYTVFSQAWSLSAIKEFDKNDEDGFFAETYTLYNGLIVCVCTILIILNIPMAKFLYMKDFFVAWNYSSVLLIAVMLNAMTAFLGSLFVAVKNSKVIAYTTIISAVIKIVFNLILIPCWGIMGAAVSTVICYFSMLVIRYITIRRYIILRINILRDLFVYFLLIIQVFLEHRNNHCYLGQLCVCVVILCIYREKIIKIISAILSKIKKDGVKK